MIDTSGTTFLFRLIEETGASVPDLTRAWLVAREVFDMPAFWRQVEELEGRVGLAAQITLLLEGRKLTERAVRWLLHNRRPPFDIQATVNFFADGVRTVRAGLPKLLTGRDLAGFEERRDSYLALGVPLDLAERVAAMVPTYSAFDIVQVASATGRPRGGRRGLLRPRRPAADHPAAGPHHRAAPRGPLVDHGPRRPARRLYAAHASLTQDVLGVSGSGLPRTPGGAARGLGLGQRGGGRDGEPDARRDLGERALHVHHPVGGPARHPDPGRRQLATPGSVPRGWGVVSVPVGGGAAAGDDLYLGALGGGRRVDRGELEGPVRVHPVIADLWSRRGEQRGEAGGDRDRRPGHRPGCSVVVFRYIP